MTSTQRVLCTCIFGMSLSLSAPLFGQTDCGVPAAPTFTVHLPLLTVAPDDEGQGWDRPPVWDGYGDARSDSIVVPNGRPIYALIVSGYVSNRYLDELMVYRFARHLMANGAYVHYSWWNNLLAPYMERPLHHSQSEPGSLDEHATDFVNMTAEEAGRKAVPAEDYQFLADAKRFLSAIREHNPNAMIVVVGHSMGGGAVVHLGAQTNVVLDILAPIDPVGNRNFPFAGNDRLATSDFNWTRWRVSRDNFLGYKQSDWDPDLRECVPVGPWLARAPLVGSTDIRCLAVLFRSEPDKVRFRSNVINLFHRYQREYLFPFDYSDTHHFDHTAPPNGETDQAAIAMTPEFCGFADRCSDPGGWPALTLPRFACCASGEGVGWPRDGHGEIVGHRGPLPDPIPLAVRVRTSPNCGAGCPDGTWPSRTQDGTWSNGDGLRRRQLLTELETIPASSSWDHRPTNADLCLVSSGLIDLFDTMNRPPTAAAGADQILECTGLDGVEVTLDGSASVDPEDDALTYSWEWPGGRAAGEVVKVTVPIGETCFSLTIRDPSGHIDRDDMFVKVQDTTGPAMSVELFPPSLWPPNHKMAEIEAEVSAEDLCGAITELVLVSVVSNEPDDGKGDGHTTGDIAETELNSADTSFLLRAERKGGGGGRVYTVTYRATDEAGNSTVTSADVVVRNKPPGRPREFEVTYGAPAGNTLAWMPSREADFQSFAIYRSTDPQFASVSKVATTTSPSWIDTRYRSTGVFYRVTAIDQTGQEGTATAFDPTANRNTKRSHGRVVGTGRLPEPAATPLVEAVQLRTYLGNVRPNPTSGAASIEFGVAHPAATRLDIYSVAGRRVRTITQQQFPAGVHHSYWDGLDDQGTRIPAGIYFVRMSVDGKVMTRKFLLMR